MALENYSKFKDWLLGLLISANIAMLGWAGKTIMQVPINTLEITNIKEDVKEFKAEVRAEFEKRDKKEESDHEKVMNHEAILNDRSRESKKYLPTNE